MRRSDGRTTAPRGGRIRAVVVAAAALGVLLSGCVRAGVPHPQHLDPSTLDVGANSIDPLTPPAGTEQDGRVLESVRMGEAIIDPAEVDPTLTRDVANRTAPVPSPVKAAGILAEPVREVLESHGMLAGYVVSGTDVENRDSTLPAPGSARLLSVLLLRFPDAQAAQLAARQMDATDAAVSPDNVAVRLAEYPAAFAHWRPGVPTMAATIADGPFVVSVLAGHTAADQALLAGTVRAAVDRQLPRLRAFVPTARDRIADLPLDQDGMIARLIPYGAGHWPRPSVVAMDSGPLAGWSASLRISGIVLGPRATRLLKNLELPDTIERIAMNGYNRLERYPDAVAARRAFLAAQADFPEPQRAAATPAGVPDVYCRTGVAVQPQLPIQVRCQVLYGRYVASVVGLNLTDAQQRSAAQYAVLVRGA
ncbi:hypothetical protein ACFYTF_09155 [Nocardia thailandica]|uniref:Uncharacterized protein n=1 Tax=Nocardia thailandica TaxID=257275 RepID=A0ABW6PKR4_9NOCA